MSSMLSINLISWRIELFYENGCSVFTEKNYGQNNHPYESNIERIHERL